VARVVALVARVVALVARVVALVARVVALVAPSLIIAAFRSGRNGFYISFSLQKAPVLV